MLSIEQVKALSQAFGYAIKSTIEEEQHVLKGSKISFAIDMRTAERILIGEFWEALTRTTPFRERQVENEVANTAKGYTIAYMKWCRETGCNHEIKDPPEWGKEYR